MNELIHLHLCEPARGVRERRPLFLRELWWSCAASVGRSHLGPLPHRQRLGLVQDARGAPAGEPARRALLLLRAIAGRADARRADGLGWVAAGGRGAHQVQLLEHSLVALHLERALDFVCRQNHVVATTRAREPEDPIL